MLFKCRAIGVEMFKPGERIIATDIRLLTAINVFA